MEYIEHHGILGQKWGKQNGPPYPLHANQKSSAEKKLDKATGYRNKAAEYKSKVPSHYVTTFGQHKARKYTEKAMAAEGKAEKIEKDLSKQLANNKDLYSYKKEYDRLCKERKNALNELGNTYVKKMSKYQDDDFSAHINVITSKEYAALSSKLNEISEQQKNIAKSFVINSLNISSNVSVYDIDYLAKMGSNYLKTVK